MRKTALSFTVSPAAISPSPDGFLPVAALPRLVDSWLLVGDINRHNPCITENRRLSLGQFVWFLNQRGLTHCGPHDVRAFLHYLTRGHEEPGGRWGNPRLTKTTKPSTVRSHHTTLKAFFNWLMAEREITMSPIVHIP
jgi:site-specific recombinase XerD